MRTLALPVSSLAVTAFALTACGGGGEANPGDLTQEQREQIAEEVVTREFFDCDDDEDLTECQDRYEEETAAEMQEAMDEYEAEIEESLIEDEEGDEEIEEPGEELAGDQRSGDDGVSDYGEAIEISGWGEGIDYEPAGTLTLNSLEIMPGSPACDELEYAPLNGHFLALDLSVDAYSEAYEDVWVSEYDFYLVDDQGTIYRDEAQSFEAFGCASELGMLEEVPPGTNHTGLIMLDTHLTEGALVYQGYEGDIHWEF